ncbi:MAG: ABC transporter transmembrane domain-containing protein, partial [Flavobacteriales bacterium]
MSRPDSVSGKAVDLPLLRRILSYTKPYSGHLWLAGSLTVLLGFVAPMRPWLIKITLDDYIILPNQEGLLFMVILIIGILMAESVLQYWHTWITSVLGQSVINDLRRDVYNKILTFHLGKFDKTPIGTLVTRVVSDVETVADIFSQGLLSIIGDLLKLLLVIAMMFFTNWKLTLISLSSIPLLLIA